MFDRILALFDRTAHKTELPPADARHALGALLVRAAKADRAYLFQEVEQIDKILARRHGLDPVEAARMRAQCELLDEKLPATDELATILLAAVPLAEREAMVAALWSVVFADQVEHEREDDLLQQVAGLLGVDHQTCRALRDIERAKQPPRRD